MNVVDSLWPVLCIVVAVEIAVLTRVDNATNIRTLTTGELQELVKKFEEEEAKIAAQKKKDKPDS